MVYNPWHPGPKRLSWGSYRCVCLFQLFTVAYTFFPIAFTLAEVIIKGEKLYTFNKSWTCLMSLAYLVILVNNVQTTPDMWTSINVILQF